jgi:hypothetical protein
MDMAGEAASKEWEGSTSLSVLMPHALPSELKRISSTPLLSMKVPPWMAQRRENPSGIPAQHSESE